MFKSLRNKLKKAVSSFSKEVKEEVEDAESEETIEFTDEDTEEDSDSESQEKEKDSKRDSKEESKEDSSDSEGESEKKGFFKKIFRRKKVEPEKEDEKEKPDSDEKKPEKEEATPKRKKESEVEESAAQKKKESIAEKEPAKKGKESGKEEKDKEKKKTKKKDKTDELSEKAERKIDEWSEEIEKSKEQDNRSDESIKKADVYLKKGKEHEKTYDEEKDENLKKSSEEATKEILDEIDQGITDREKEKTNEDTEKNIGREDIGRERIGKEEIGREEIEKEEKKGSDDGEKEGFFKKIFKKKKKVEPEEITEDQKEIQSESEKTDSSIKKESKKDGSDKDEKSNLKSETEAEKKETPEKKSMFGKIADKITKKTLSEDKFENIFYELEIALLENNVALEVVDKIKSDLLNSIVGKPLPRGRINEMILDALKKSIENVLDIQKIDLLEEIEKAEKPYVISFIGVNGSGKTTSLAKMAHYLKKKGLDVVVAAADTFRAAAIQQLEEHTTNLDVKLIKHDYGADPAAVCYDAIEHAKSKGKDVVLIDTAGRLHSNKNLMGELKKVEKVSNPDLTLFVGESVTGNDCVEQALQFGEAVKIDGLILTKVDVDDKGGAALSVSYVTKKPIMFIGLGQDYDDLKVFDKHLILQNLGLEG